MLLIACANVANLLLVRAAAREREFAVRAAVGGRRSALVRQLLVESMVMAGMGGLLGAGLALAGTRLLLLLEPAELPRVESIGLDGAVLGFTAITTIAAALLFGIVPALRASRPDIVMALRESGRTPGLSANRALRSGVVVAEVALSLVLVVGAGLMVRSFIELHETRPGWTADRILSFNVPLPFGRYPAQEQRQAFADRLHESLLALPGVERVTSAAPIPLDGQLFNGRWGPLEARADASLFQQADYTFVGPDYFETLGTRVIDGRSYTAVDHADSLPIIVVDAKLAAKAFPDRPAVGERILVRFNSPDPVEMEIIGVVEHQRRSTLAQDGRETIFFTQRQAGSAGFMTWMIRSAGEPSRVAASVRTAVAALDPGLPVADLRPLDDYVARAMAPTRFALILIACFGAVAAVLAAVGLYGVLASTVRQRTAEIGVRVAFGASRRSITGLVVGHGLSLGGAGIALGTLAAFGLTRVMRSLLVGVAPTDPLTFAGVIAAFLVVVAMASWLPARRAARMDPLAALRSE
ncbi:MAG: FtsX-like permease family protein [Gemmatimonadetes bacterium]|nr:FtsX-like permease family protein [Gemmatimonadota bacterium]